jgi:hypothetical protein
MCTFAAQTAYKRTDRDGGQLHGAAVFKHADRVD